VTGVPTVRLSLCLVISGITGVVLEAPENSSAQTSSSVPTQDW
jgi:hypothetical protein